MATARILTALRGLRGPRPAPRAPVGHESLACPVCRSRFLCPLDWGIADDDHWWVRSRCGECGAWCEQLITNEQAARLDRELDHQVNQIRRAAARMESERMASEIETFIQALNRDLIDAADFA
jgi:hypothetical protein